MSEFDINVKNLAASNSKLPRLVSRANTIKHKIALMKWRIPEDIQGELNINSSLNDAITNLDDVSSRISQLHTTLDSVISTVINTDRTVKSKIDRFE